MYLVAFILSLYVILIIIYRIGWEKLSNFQEVEYTPFVSVVIAMRNESKHVNRLLEEITNQMYSKKKYEIIIVNDHSTDETLELLHQFKSPLIKVFSLQENEGGKKRAVKKAVSIAKGDIIITTDADCSVKPYWISKIAACFIDKKIKLVAGPVAFYNSNNIFCDLQSLEFSSLIGSSAGAIGVNRAILCNGANMAFRKNVFLSKDNISNEKIVSGDDVFLLHSLKRLYKESVFFIKDQDAIVMTQASITLSEFINQRKRWAAKSVKYKDLDTVFVSYLILLTNLTFVALLIATMINFDLFFLFALFYFIKFTVDFLILYPVLNFFNRKDLLKWILPFEIIYSFYIIFIVLNSFSSSFIWKDRTHIK